MEIKINKNVVIETDGMSIQQLQDLADELKDIQIKISSDLAEAKAHQLTTGEYADAVWFRKANSARSIVSHNLSKLQRVIKGRKHEENQALSDIRQLSFEQRFIRVAKEFLHEDTFQSILKLTEIEHDG